MLRTRTFDTDEFEHLHAAWSYHQGLLPYRDFFEHHMPGIYYLLSALMRGYDTAHQASDAIAVLFVARTVMWVFAGAVIALTFQLGTRYGGKAVGWLGAAFLSLSVVFVARSLEIRPDVPAAAFWVASQCALVRALTPRHDRGANRLWWILGGLMLGATLVFTQKALLAGPGFAIFAAIYVLTRDRDRPATSKVLDLAIFVGTAAIPLLLVAAHFWAQGSARALLDGVLINNLGWVQELTAGSTLRWMLLRDPFLCAFAAAGFLRAAFLIFRDRDQSAWRAAVFLPTASLFAGMAVIPTPFPQYLLPVLPAAAVYAADFLRSALSDSQTAGTRRFGRIESLLTMTTFVVVATIGAAIAQPFFRHVAIYPMLGGTVAAVVLWLLWRGHVDYACAVVIVAVSAYSVQQLVWMAGLRNTEALAQIRFIHSATTPTDRVMDGFTGVGWFRPHAAFYWKTAPGVRARIPAEERARMVAMLEGCADRPKVVILDEHLRSLSPEVAKVVSEHYHLTQSPPLWLRNEAAGDCDVRSSEVSKSSAKSLPVR